MAGGKRLTGCLARTILPRLQNIVHAVERAFLGPEHKERALYFLVQVGSVVGQVDGSGGPVVFTQSADRGWIAEAAQIFVIRRLAHPLRDVFTRLLAAKTKEQCLEEKFGAIFEHCFRKWRRLNEQEPVEKDGGEVLVYGLIALISRHNVENGKLGDAVDVIESHAMGDAAPAIVSHERKFAKSQMLHDFDLILSHGAFGIAVMIRAARRLAAIAVSTKVRDH